MNIELYKKSPEYLLDSTGKPLHSGKWYRIHGRSGKTFTNFYSVPKLKKDYPQTFGSVEENELVFYVGRYTYHGYASYRVGHGDRFGFMYACDVVLEPVDIEKELANLDDEASRD